jgi:AbrB family looped-hinge helix DNA binding protein
MRTTIDAGGRVVIPKAIRASLGLSPGQELDIEERDGRIEIEVAATPVRLVERDGVVVGETDRVMPPLTDDVVRATLERVRR